MPTSTPPGPTPRRHRARSALALGALTVASIAGSLLSGAPAQASTTGPAGGHVGTRAQIPWKKVGPGWTLATWSPSTKQNSEAKVSLFLVDGTGDRYLVAKLSAGSEPLAMSPAGQQALVRTEKGQLADIDLHTGYSHQIAIPDLDSVIGYTAPKGVSLLVSVDIERGNDVIQRLERFGAGGRHELTFPDHDNVAGHISIYGVQQSSDGRQVIAGADHGLIDLRNSNGTVIRRLIPQKRNCQAAGWWSKGVVLASCDGVLYTVPVSGAKAHQISRASKQDPFGYETAWQTGRSTPPLGLAANGCGPTSLVRFDHNGHGIRFSVPSPIGRSGMPIYVGHHADDVTMLFNPGGSCEDHALTLFSYDAARNRSTALLGTTVNGGTVVDAVAFPINS